MCLKSYWLCVNRCPSICRRSPMNNVALDWRNGKWRRQRQRQRIAMKTTSPLTATDTCGSEVSAGSPPTLALSTCVGKSSQSTDWIAWLCIDKLHAVTLSVRTQVMSTSLKLFRYNRPQLSLNKFEFESCRSWTCHVKWTTCHGCAEKLDGWMNGLTHTHTFMK